MSTTDRASQNREYVRRLLKKKQPEFAAVLDRVVWELTYTCNAPSAESPAFEHDRGGRLGPSAAMPALWAMAAASVRLAASSLARIPGTWTLAALP